ncbi:MAG TPA: preprotein translocase subunit YajC [Defluviitoga sp.]|nr:preprotein translocase subunit YajC [Defluviitoga sp.]
MYEKILDFINFGPAGASDAQGAAEQAQAAPGGGFGGLIFLLVVLVLMWVMLFLPQRRQEKKHKEMISSLKKGDKIVTSAGIIGKIVSISNDTIRIATGDRTEIDITKNAVAGILSPKPSAEDKLTEAEEGNPDEKQDVEKKK